MSWGIATTVAAALFGIASAVLWWVAASIVVPDNIDTFIGELQRAGKWNARAATCASIAALLTALSLLVR
jgi:hypothetical protein